MKKWKTIRSDQIVRDRWISLRADECELPNGSRIYPYYVIDEKEWVHVFAVDSNDRILVVRQYRHAADVVCLELPGGVVDTGELPLDAAKRELQEETGFSARTWTRIGAVHANPARQTNAIHIFTASDLHSNGAPSLDETEEIESTFMSAAEVKTAIGQGLFSQAMHVASFYMGVEALAHRTQVRS
jgi:ADP-ribose pyrophosphatase